MDSEGSVRGLKPWHLPGETVVNYEKDQLGKSVFWPGFKAVTF
jgi:hypothetical protein